MNKAYRITVKSGSKELTIEIPLAERGSVQVLEGYIGSNTLEMAKGLVEQFNKIK